MVHAKYFAVFVESRNSRAPSNARVAGPTTPDRMAFAKGRYGSVVGTTWALTRRSLPFRSRRAEPAHGPPVDRTIRPGGRRGPRAPDGAAPETREGPASGRSGRCGPR